MAKNKFFEIKDYDDIYIAVGKIIKASQELEQLFKRYAILIGVETPNLEVSTLNTLNKKLHNKGFYDDKLYMDLKKVIIKRNYINHEFFIEHSNNNDYEKISNKLNSIYFYIFEASDVIQNFIDNYSGRLGNRPTIFDNK